MSNYDQVFDSMCEMAQKLIDQMDKLSGSLIENQFEELQRKIDKIHKYMEEFSLHYRKIH